MRVFAALVFVGCSGAPTTPSLVLSSPAALGSPPRTTRSSDCRIEGNGERSLDDVEAPLFSVLAHRHAADAVLVIADPDRVHVVWSELPGTTHDGLARIDLGGQEHVRYTGYTRLAGRRFSIKRRFASEPGHLWARAGAPVELVSFDGGVLEALVTTPFASPKTLTVRGSCDGVIYDPSEPDVARPKEVAPLGRVAVRGTLLELYAAPSGAPFVALHIDTDQPIELDIVERTESFLRVHAAIGDVDIDAWAPTTQLKDDDVGGGGSNGTGIGIGSFGTSATAIGTLVRDAPLFVGAKPVPLEGAYVEKGARVYVYSEETINGQRYTSFGFLDRLITAPANARLWVASDAIRHQ
jgi:hypothetical protein